MDCLVLRRVQLESRKLRDQLIQSPYAFPGGYPTALCPATMMGFTSSTPGIKIDLNPHHPIIPSP